MTMQLRCGPVTPPPLVHLSDHLTQRALGFLSDWYDDQIVDVSPAPEAQDRPFFLNVWFLSPHKELHPQEAVCNALCPPPINPTVPPCVCPPTLEEPDRYALMVELLDEKVGELVGYLEATPDPHRTGKTLAETTLIVFTSDNGGLSAFHKPSQQPHRPFSGFKDELWEGGIRVPMLARWLDKADWGGIANSSIVASMDWLPTFGELAGLDAAGLAALEGDGESFASVFSTPAVPRARAKNQGGLVFEFQSGTEDSDPEEDDYNAYAVRQGDWKFLSFTDDNGLRQEHLFDLATDPGEQINCAQPGTSCAAGPSVASLKAIYGTWREDQVIEHTPVVCKGATLSSDTYSFGGAGMVEIPSDTRYDHHDGEFGLITDVTPDGKSLSGPAAESIIARRDGSWRLFTSTVTGRIYLRVYGRYGVNSPAGCDSMNTKDVLLRGPVLTADETYRVAISFQGRNNEGGALEDNAIRLYVSGAGVPASEQETRLYNKDWPDFGTLGDQIIVTCPDPQEPVATIQLGGAQPGTCDANATVNQPFTGSIRIPRLSAQAPYASEVSGW